METNQFELVLQTISTGLVAKIIAEQPAAPVSVESIAAVTYTETAVRGDTSSSIVKDATLETGVIVKVPAFIKTGDEISIDTETHAYRERKK